MVSTINSLVTGRNIDLLTIINKSVNNNTDVVLAKNETTSDVLKPLNIGHETAVVSLAQWLSKSKFVSKLSYNLNASRAFNSNKHDVIFNFALAEKYANHFVLLRGLFDFHNIPSVSVYADRTNKSFRVELRGDDAVLIVEYFNFIFTSLAKEINFKQILKGIIKLEQRIKRERDLAYGSLRAAV
jgi:hypothetical protein